MEFNKPYDNPGLLLKLISQSIIAANRKHLYIAALKG